jgi:hypothetical protein
MTKPEFGSVTFRQQIFMTLALTGMVLLTACGDPTATALLPTTAAVTPPATTAPVATSSLAPTTQTSTTAVTTAATTTPTIAPTTPATAVPATTASSTVSSTTDASIQELFSLIPDTADNLSQLTYSNYAAFKAVAGIPPNATFRDLQNKKSEALSKFITETRYLAGSSQIALINYAATNPSDLVGYDLLQLDADAQAGMPPNIISLAKGSFDYAAIEKAYTSNGAAQAKIGAYNSYGFDKLDLNNPIQQMVLSPAYLLALPDKKMLAFSRSKDLLETETKLVDGAKTPSTVSNNPGVKALLEVFGAPWTVFISNKVFTPRALTAFTDAVASGTVAPNEIKKQVEEFMKAPLPVPVLGGLSYAGSNGNVRSYVVANYYLRPEDAQSALPVLEKGMREGISNQSKQPYNKYFEVVSAEVKGNLLVFKLNLKANTPLTQFLFSRDLPAFWI